jgi:hypothetical protein
VPAVRPPLRWQFALGTVLLLALLFAAHSSLRAAINAELVESPAAVPVTVLSFAIPLALFVSYVVWANLTKGLVEGYGGVLAVAHRTGRPHRAAWRFLNRSPLSPRRHGFPAWAAAAARPADQHTEHASVAAR